MHTRIVDIGDKHDLPRQATAEGTLRVRPETRALIEAGRIAKGPVLTVAEVAALQAVKRTPDWLPLCHPVPITSADVEWQLRDDTVRLRVTVAATYKTGVEMEALVATTAGLLTVWDMVKSLEKDPDGQYPDARITDIHVVEKRKASGGDA